jgi:hypothetical protein
MRQHTTLRRDHLRMDQAVAEWIFPPNGNEDVPENDAVWTLRGRRWFSRSRGRPLQRSPLIVVLHPTCRSCSEISCGSRRWLPCGFRATSPRTRRFDGTKPPPATRRAGRTRICTHLIREVCVGQQKEARTKGRYRDHGAVRRAPPQPTHQTSGPVRRGPTRESVDRWESMTARGATPQPSTREARLGGRTAREEEREATRCSRREHGGRRRRVPGREMEVGEAEAA